MPPSPSGSVPDPLPERVHVAVVGCGFSGLGAAIKLLEAGFRDLVVLERGDRVGGTWRDNSYPGCACDVPSNLYSFSFAPEPSWSRSFAPAAEIQDYLERCVDRFGVRPHLHLGTEVTRSSWDDERHVWVIETSRGRLEAEALVGGVGPLAEPSLPEVPGLSSFEGLAFHSARWPGGLDMTGRRVAVVGTGASSVQIIPAIADEVDRLVVLQRTPAWVIPRRDRPRPEIERRLYAALPFVQKVARESVFLTHEELNLRAFLSDGPIRRMGEAQARRHLEKQVTDPVMRRRLTPDYRMGCKRVLLSDDFYPALTKPHVDLVAAGLREVLPDRVVDSEGGEHVVDTIVFATGFHVTDLPAAASTIGREGRSLAEVWKGSPVAYNGVAVAGFPNMFLLLGPNTGLGHNSVVTMIEAQVGYVVRSLLTMRRNGASVVEVRPERQAAYDEEIQERVADTVWATGGCQSWYVDDNGRVAAIWPRSVLAYRRRLRRVDHDAYVWSRPLDARCEVRSVVADDGARLHVEVVGPPASDTTTTVVMVHGWTLDRRLWRKQVETLVARRPDLRVAAYDQRGHGLSDRGEPGLCTIDQIGDDLVAVLDDVAPAGRVVLVGHSMGGMTVMAASHSRPSFLDRVDGVVLVNTSSGQVSGLTYGMPRSIGQAFGRAIPVALRISSAAERRGMPRRHVPGTERLAYAAGADVADVALTTGMELWTRADVTAEFHTELRAHDRQHVLSALDGTPTVVMVGSQDRLTPVSHARRIAAAVPGSRLEVLDGAGHMLPLERPDAVTSAILSLVDGQAHS